MVQFYFILIFTHSIKLFLSFNFFNPISVFQGLSFTPNNLFLFVLLVPVSRFFVIPRIPLPFLYTILPSSFFHFLIFPWDNFSHYSLRNWTHLAPLRLSTSSFEGAEKGWKNGEFVNLAHRKSLHSLSSKWCIASPRRK